jgi:hypothetical protein
VGDTGTSDALVSFIFSILLSLTKSNLIQNDRKKVISSTLIFKGYIFTLNQIKKIEKGNNLDSDFVRIYFPSLGDTGTSDALVSFIFSILLSLTKSNTFLH